MSHIFISYSHKDKEYVHKLHDALVNEGFDVWIDDRIDYGDKWLKAIEKNLDACDAFIIVMSKNSSESEMVQNEITRARDLGKQIFPLLLDGKNWLVVQARQFVDVRDGSLPTEKFYRRLETVTHRKNKKAEREAAERLVQEEVVREKAEQAVVEKALLELDGRQRLAKEKTDHKRISKPNYEDTSIPNVIHEPSAKSIDNIPKNKTSTFPLNKQSKSSESVSEKLLTGKSELSGKTKTAFMLVASIGFIGTIIAGLFNSNILGKQPLGNRPDVSFTATLRPTPTTASPTNIVPRQPVMTYTPTPLYPVNWLLYSADGVIEALNLYNHELVSVAVNSCDNDRSWFIPEEQVIFCNYFDTYAFDHEQFTKLDGLFERGEVTSFVQGDNYYYSANYGNGSELRKLDVAGDDPLLVDYENVQISSTSQTKNKPYSSVDVNRVYDLIVESISPSLKYIVYRVDALDIQSTRYWGGTGYMGTTPGPGTQRPREYFVLNTETETKIKIYCDRFLYWSFDSELVVCLNGAHRSSDGSRVDIPYTILSEYVISYSAWDSIKENLAFIADGNIFVYRVSTNEVNKIEGTSNFSYLSWLPGDNILLAANGDIYLIEINMSKIEQVTTTAQEETVIGWIP